VYDGPGSGDTAWLAVILAIREFLLYRRIRWEIEPAVASARAARKEGAMTHEPTIEDLTIAELMAERDRLTRERDEAVALLLEVDKRLQQLVHSDDAVDADHVVARKVGAFLARIDDQTT
jgi:hypothetical protein